MNLDSPDTWRWIWIVGALIFVCCELVTPAVFFFLPFAIGALLASLLSFAGLGVSASWTIFMIVSGIAFASLWKLGRRLERADGEQEGVGATRWVGQEARVLEEIGAGGIGLIRLDREEWRAESLTGDAIRKGSTVVVTRVAGTRLVVVPVEEPPEDLSLGNSSLGNSSLGNSSFGNSSLEGSAMPYIPKHDSEES